MCISEQALTSALPQPQALTELLVHPDRTKPLSPIRVTAPPISLFICASYFEILWNFNVYMKYTRTKTTRTLFDRDPAGTMVCISLLPNALENA